MKKGGLFPLISPKSVPDGLVCWLVGEGIKFLKEGGLFHSYSLNGSLMG